MSNREKKTKPTYKYYIQNAMTYDHFDEYVFLDDEYNLLHKFFITYSMAKDQSSKIKTCLDYGWSSEKITESEFFPDLRAILPLYRNKNFIFIKKGNLKEEYERLGLFDRKITEIDTERGVFIVSNQDNNYLTFFQKIRNGLAHGNYKLIYSKQNKKMIIIQDNNSYNVTARIVIELKTLLDIASLIDKNMILLGRKL